MFFALWMVSSCQLNVPMIPLSRMHFTSQPRAEDTCVNNVLAFTPEGKIVMLLSMLPEPGRMLDYPGIYCGSCWKGIVLTPAVSILDFNAPGQCWEDL